MLVEILKNEKVDLVELLLNLYFQDYKEEFYFLYIICLIAVMTFSPLGGSYEIHLKFERIKNFLKKEGVEIFE